MLTEVDDHFLDLEGKAFVLHHGHKDDKFL